MTTARELLQTLSDPHQEIHWDECWDRLMGDRLAETLSDSDLIDALERGSSLAQIFAIRQLHDRNADINFWEDRLSALMATADDLVRTEALRAAKSVALESTKVRDALRAMRNRSTEHLGLRLKAGFYLASARSRAASRK